MLRSEDRQWCGEQLDSLRRGDGMIRFIVQQARSPRQLPKDGEERLLLLGHAMRIKTDGRSYASWTRESNQHWNRNHPHDSTLEADTLIQSNELEHQGKG